MLEKVHMRLHNGQDLLARLGGAGIRLVLVQGLFIQRHQRQFAFVIVAEELGQAVQRIGTAHL